MALTNAERQARYRQKHLRDADTADMRFLRLTLDVSTRNKLERIAQHRDTSITAMITAWADKTESRIVDKLTPKEQKKYYATTDLKLG